jgi:hypothetical protein
MRRGVGPSAWLASRPLREEHGWRSAREEGSFGRKLVWVGILMEEAVVVSEWKVCWCL